MDKLKELAELGREMRKAQAYYFSTRQSSALNTAKKLEKQFDKLVEEILNPKAIDTQQPLI